MGFADRFPASADTSPNVLEVSDLNVSFRTPQGMIHAVNGINFDLKPGELLVVVGESGSGKSVAMMSLLRLLPTPPAHIGGSVRLRGLELTHIKQSEIRKVRGRRIGFVFQDPMTSLNPVFSVGYQITESLRNNMGMGRREARNRAIALLEMVGIPAAARRIDDYPHQFSGGMRQRVVIAMALACDPEVLIADEPTTALDVTVQAQIIRLVHGLRERLGMAVIWITHDLGVAAAIADRVIVMYGGQIVEQAPVTALFETPRHPYTRALLDSLPVRHAANERLRAIEGSPSVLWRAPARCTFTPRCPMAQEACRRHNPPLAEVTAEHKVACWRSSETGDRHASP